MIDCAFKKNCATEAYLIIVANDSSINISKNEIDTGIGSACEAYERFNFGFPIVADSFHIKIIDYEKLFIQQVN